MTASLSFHHRLRRWLQAPVEVPLVCEIAADYVAAVRHHQGRIESWAVRGLPDGAVRPGPVSDNIVNAAAVQQALEQVMESVADGQRRCMLLVPDLLARVVVLEFDRLPGGSEDVDALLRWRLSKDVPFDIRQAAVSFHIQAGRSGMQEALVAVCLRALLRQYEECLERVGLQPGWVTCSTLAALGCLDSSSASASLLVKRDHRSLSLAVVHGDAVRLFRSLPTPGGAGTQPEAALSDKVYPAVVYFRDQWGRGVNGVFLVSGDQVSPSLAKQLEQEAGCPVGEMSLEAFDLPPSPVSGASPDQRLVPSLGWARGGAG